MSLVKNMNAKDDKRFVCNECVYTTKFESFFERHKRKHAGEKPYSLKSLRLRNLIFKKRNCLYTTEKKVTYDQCGRSISSKTFFLNRRIIHEEGKSCKGCQRYFENTYNDQITHSRLGPLVCDECVVSFLHVNDLFKHLKKHTVEKPFKCDQCSYASAYKSSLIEHKRTHTCDQVFDCNRSSSSAVLKCDLVEDKRMRTCDKAFKCDQCSYSTVQKCDLVEHMGTHTCDQIFKCDQCSYSTVQKCDLVEHMRTHTCDQTYKCDRCSYSFSQKSDLVEHMGTHTCDQTFKCDRCSYSTAQKCDLVEHMRTHTCDQTFKCDRCSYSFSQKCDLVEHMRTQTCDVSFKCDKCSYSTAQKCDLVEHKRTHTMFKGFKCSHCSFSSAQKHVLDEHKKTHTGTKLFKSDQCSNMCDGKFVYNEHVRKLTSMKRFKCDHCSHSFTRKYSLHRHETTLHSGKKHTSRLGCDNSCGIDLQLRVPEIDLNIQERLPETENEAEVTNNCDASDQPTTQYEHHPRAFDSTVSLNTHVEPCSVKLQSVTRIDIPSRSGTSDQPPSHCDPHPTEFAEKSFRNTNVQPCSVEPQSYTRTETIYDTDGQRLSDIAHQPPSQYEHHSTAFDAAASSNTAVTPCSFESESHTARNIIYDTNRPNHNETSDQPLSKYKHHSSAFDTTASPTTSVKPSFIKPPSNFEIEIIYDANRPSGGDTSDQISCKYEHQSRAVDTTASRSTNIKPSFFERQSDSEIEIIYDKKRPSLSDSIKRVTELTPFRQLELDSVKFKFEGPALKSEPTDFINLLSIPSFVTREYLEFRDAEYLTGDPKGIFRNPVSIQ